jgi:HEAT repeat protein
MADLAADRALPALGPAVLPDLLAGLNLQGKAADGHALLAVCWIDREQGRDWCRRALAEGNAYLRVQALRWCLPRVAPAAEVVRTARDWLARDRNWRRRQQAVEALCQAGPAAAPAVPELIATLAEGPLSLTDAVARALAAVGPPAVRPLTAALRDTNPAVRAGAAISLGRLRERANTAPVVAALHEALRDGDEKVRSAAVEALVAVAPESPRTVAALVARLKERGPGGADARTLAAVYLDGLGPPARAAIPALLEALQDPDAGVRGHAAMALKTHGPDKASAVPALVRALREDSNRYVRGAAAEILGQLGRRARPAAPALVAALQDPEGHVRSSAAAALREVGADPAVAVPALAALLPHPQEWCRLAAMRALARFGRRARAAVPALTALLQTEANDYVRREAEETLAIVRGQAAPRW